MGLFGEKILGGGLVDVIRCDEPSYLIWKWHPEGTIPGKNRKENEIRIGSKLLVEEESVAVFVYSDGAETKTKIVEGPAETILRTLNFPIVSTIYGKLYGGNSPFRAEVYFINLSKAIKMIFAVPFFEVRDTAESVSVAIRGEIKLGITDYKEFIKLNGLKTFSIDNLKDASKSAITRIVKEVVAEAPKNLGVPFTELESKISEVNNLVGEKIWDYFYKNLGITISEVNVFAIEID